MAEQPTRPPAQPTYILRGHSAQIHAVHFLRRNSRLLTGDADGWVVLWSTTTKRSVGVWKAHKNTILGLGSWTDDRIITHGRDNKLHVWYLPPSDEAHLSTTLPMDVTDSTAVYSQPKLLHSIAVHTLNFCAFAACPAPWPSSSSSLQPSSNNNRNVSNNTSSPQTNSNGTTIPHPLLLATPGVQDGHVHVTTLPSEARVATIPTPSGTNTGMLMAVGLHVLSPTSSARTKHPDTNSQLPASTVTNPLTNPPPAPSTRAAPSDSTQSPAIQPQNDALVVLAGYESGHVGVWRQQQQRSPTPLQSQGRRPAPAWQSVYLSAAHTQPVLSLGIAGGRGVFFSAGADAVIAQHPLRGEDETHRSAAVQTRHAGQQSLAVRSDEGIFATAGWDGRARVYAAATLRELAVLKWHQEGCYALAFAEVEGREGGGVDGRDGDGKDDNDGKGGGRSESGTMVAARSSTVANLREQRAASTHWIAAGSKDGKVSLWDIY